MSWQNFKFQAYVLYSCIYHVLMMFTETKKKQQTNKKDYDKYVRVNVETQFTTFRTENVVKFFL